MAASAPCVSVNALNRVDLPTFGSPTIAVCNFIDNAVLEYDLFCCCELDTRSVVCVNDDRETNAIVWRVIVANMMTNNSRMFICCALVYLLLL